MTNILVLHTGGTISMTANAAGDVAPSAENPLMGQVDQLGADIHVTAEEIFNLPSPHMTPELMLELAQRIRRAEANGVDGVVVTHGTDTLEETAYFLDLTLDSTIPVVVTGAMRSSNEIGSDGLYNFITAIRTAASPESRHKGCLVVMNDEIHTARFVTKTHTTNVATFRTPTFGPIGLVTKDGVRFFQELINQEACLIDNVVPNVFLLKAYAGMDATLFDALPKNTNGLVIEALGAGNLPPATLPGLQRLLDRHVPIVLVSRCFNGVAEGFYDYEGGGVELEKMGIIFCQGLNGQKARIKLIVGLSDGKQGADLKAYVNNAIS
ncbi:asparaginase [Lacticaseibacillus thailandensis]|uniref:asparaginase n=1 Tax=Lacticaseibacillus thailandensis DSM 22698 = JCM 13996 TaxID=1423810 RepID=A0A0R2C4S6_9LACO|nr:asparaginase [Lacticaseibacillus thailandensis]KRM86721.1 asparaginase [Lacticaseibacillus thailandensis DSM 22698 = JCM 13996]